MELKIKEVSFPELIAFNFEELKAEITSKAELYKNMTYTDATIKEAKADKAKLNKFVTALEDKKKEVKRQCLEPYEAFEKQMKELVSIIKEPVELIDTQVKAYEKREKEEKLEKIKDEFTKVGFQHFVGFDRIFNQKWLNKSISMKSIIDEMTTFRDDIGHDVATINSLPEFSFEALEVYKDTLDLSKAIQEGQRLADIQKRKEEAKKAEEERQKALAEAEAKLEPEKHELYEQYTVNDCLDEDIEELKGIMDEMVGIEPAKKEAPRSWVAFKAYLTVSEAMELKEFFESRNIEFGRA